MDNQRLGDILLKHGSVGSKELDFCLNIQRNDKAHRLGQLLCHYNFTEEKMIAKAIADQVGWQFLEPPYMVDESMLALFGAEFFKARGAVPVRSVKGGCFVLSKTNDTATTDQISRRLGGNVIFCLGLEEDIRHSLNGIIQERRSDALKDANDDIGQWFESCLERALLQSASDIHIEPSAKVVEIRFRIDGVLYFVESLPLACLARLMNIIFHRSEVTVSDFTHFHDARFFYKYQDREIDVRVSHLPSVQGSCAVLRLLDKGKAAMKLSALGYGQETWRLISKGLMRPDGMNLIVGPTGCGKTTTLYAVLNHLKSIETKIVTIEDPVEIQLPLMTQVQISAKRGVDFSRSIRAFLRHDPDIILVGEIRDELTAQEALRASMTGHQIFATLHTRRALDALLRLHDLGISFGYMADHVSMIVSQRLVRKLCLHCRSERQVTEEELSLYQDRYLDGHAQSVAVANSCDHCRQGFKDQALIAEVLLIDEEIGEFISRGDIGALRRSLKERGYRTITDDARRLIKDKVTSLDEIVRVLG